jgi:murein DD-endopeptidase / murein LD-carboxypeptidase
MSYQRSNAATVKKRKLLLYVFGIFIVAKVAANVNGNGDALTLAEKIAAFKKDGVGKQINAEHYDKEGIIKFAETLIGTPHQMGGYSSSGLDCSGMVKLAHAQFNVELPRSSHDQARYGTILSEDEELQRGDLVYFHSTYKKKHLVTHTGIYLGDNKFIHASASRGVIVSTLHDSGYYDAHYLFATRLVD